MLKFILKWMLASLVMPIVTIITMALGFGASFANLILLFWPSSIFLMALGARENPLLDVVYVWLMAILSNALLYAIIGSVIYLIFYKLIQSK